jgi:hypothetical protein
MLKELPNNPDLYAEYEAKAFSLQAILSDAHQGKPVRT